MNLVVSFVNGREKTFKIDDYVFDEDVGYLRISKDDVEIGMIAMSQIIYWYVEDWWLITNTKIDEQK